MNEQTDSSAREDAVRLFLMGFLTLFLELVLIRYLAGNIWNLGYFPNLVLLSVFIGMGAGFLLHHTVPKSLSPILFHSAAFLLLCLVVLIEYAAPVVPGFSPWGADIAGEIYFTATPKQAGATSYSLFALWFVGIVVVFALLSQWTAKLFRQFSPLKAYTLDIAGSCAGIVAFMAMSWFQIPAYAWFFVVLPLFMQALKTKWYWRLIPIIPFVGIIAIAYVQDQSLMSNPEYQGEREVKWSPYQKVEYVNSPQHPIARGIYVNGITHQAMLRPDQIAKHFYQVPHHHRRKSKKKPYENVLIIGAGSGNDVAAALMNGASHVDACEIDPVIAEIGKEHHPSKAYHDKRVNLVIDDARGFMTQTTRRYDLVIYALTDSLVKVSSMAQLRLENYLFTQESFARAYSLLTEEGEFVIYNYYRQPWLIDKYRRTVHAATGKYPLELFKKGDFRMLWVGKADNAKPGPAPLDLVSSEIATDDFPFPYLKKKGMPELYVNALIAMFLLVFFLAVILHFLGRKRAIGEGRETSLIVKLAFVFMGIAFLLLETKSIVQFSLLFGTTWVNTSLVFLGVLILVLAANWAALFVRGKSALPVAYGLLVVSCLIGYFYPLANLLQVESSVMRFVLASLMAFSPIFFANLIFSITFRDQNVAEHIFGWNLLGATVGGLLEYTSMALGYNALGLVVAASYTIVFGLLLWHQKSTDSATQLTSASH